VDRERAEQQRRPARARRHRPQADRADQAAVLGGHEGERGLPPLAQALGWLGEAGSPVGDVEQRLARRDVGWFFRTDGDHG
jgi:hypothetical protein